MADSKDGKILFVCLRNICRSPSAEAILKHLLEKEGTALIGKSIAPEYLISITDFDRTVVALSFSPFLFLRYYDFGASRA